jgi:hypothetical protein
LHAWIIAGDLKCQQVSAARSEALTAGEDRVKVIGRWRWRPRQETLKLF